jgi:hypothetical protein
MTTYKQRVYRFVVESHEDLPEDYKAEYRLRGMDPDNMWSLLYSFMNREDAERALCDRQQRQAEFCQEQGLTSRLTFRVRDLGQDMEIERQVW